MTPDLGGPRRVAADDTAAGTDVVDILVSAFYDDPTWAWAFPDPLLRADQQRALWTLFVQGAVRYPETWLAPGSTATAVWIPPGGTELSEEQEQSLEPLMVTLLGADAPRLMATFEGFERAHPRDEPHYYLSLLGTSTAHRGHGLGLGLLAANLRAVDRTGMPAYLEASNLANVALYARHGFAPLGSVTLPAGGPEVVTMWRPGRA